MQKTIITWHLPIICLQMEILLMKELTKNFPQFQLLILDSLLKV